jgi:hypothetical protein
VKKHVDSDHATIVKKIEDGVNVVIKELKKKNQQKKDRMLQEV